MYGISVGYSCEGGVDDLLWASAVDYVGSYLADKPELEELIVLLGASGLLNLTSDGFSEELVFDGTGWVEYEGSTVQQERDTEAAVAVAAEALANAIRVSGLTRQEVIDHL